MTHAGPPPPHTVTIRGRRPRDLPVLERWLADPAAEWRRWDAPYFHPAATTASLRSYVQQLSMTATRPDERVIDLDGVCVGMVNRSEEEPAGGGWWDLGVLIYDPVHWGRGIGTRALALWVQATLDETDAHVLTFTTWGGNERMIRAARRLGFRESSRVREARVVDGQRYDSVRLDLLRREWTPPQR
ncbi:RimJ/RimL family protein N-acetyltransferase [Deinococcus metalli]|uniref:N-acetyltransferase n=1 Tax=Deinococcus metalli TaxID=1141878 RepID=A0A7W8KBU9_9DEIO|nr:GNAT family protein [Deinococcus metalli]MBB5375221.1 RimJ/RimL family protein N-acetyltransferase [Deinococcus metalli]GHF30866.1 N-acetyltransferase [Deinococcus metalli]